MVLFFVNSVPSQSVHAFLVVLAADCGATMNVGAGVADTSAVVGVIEPLSRPAGRRPADPVPLRAGVKWICR